MDGKNRKNKELFFGFPNEFRARRRRRRCGMKMEMKQENGTIHTCLA